GTSVYLGGSFSAAGGDPHARLAAVDRASGHASAWLADANGDVDALDALGTRLFAGGAFTQVGPSEVSGLAEVWPDPAVAVGPGPPRAAGPRIALAAPVPNPARARAEFRFDLPA